MKSFSERSPLTIGLTGLVLSAAVAVGALNYDKIPFVNTADDHTAYFAEAGGLLSNSPVLVAGYRVGQVDSIRLDGDRVQIQFHTDHGVFLGDRTEAAIRAKGLLGAKVLEITPRGDQPLTSPIPLDHTKSPYQLPDALGDLASTISGLNTNDVSTALATLSDTFKDTPPALKQAVEGVGRLSQSLDTRDEQLRTLLTNANKATGVLAARSDQIAELVSNTNALLSQLMTQSRALDTISANLSALARQLAGFIADNRTQLRPALDKLNGVLTIVDDRKAKIQDSIRRLNGFAMSLGEAVASGPFFKIYVANLLPGQFVQPFIDSAFSDLGLDPNVKTPEELSDPQVGQPGTPALPVPYPRTGQGGDPRLTLPDAITGKPGDQACGPPGIPLPGPGCYPYREPPAAPPPGGPPPGPPAPAPAGEATTPGPTPSPVYQTAPNEVPPSPGAQ